MAKKTHEKTDASIPSWRDVSHTLEAMGDPGKYIALNPYARIPATNPLTVQQERELGLLDSRVLLSKAVPLLMAYEIDRRAMFPRPEPPPVRFMFHNSYKLVNRPGSILSAICCA